MDQSAAHNIGYDPRGAARYEPITRTHVVRIVVVIPHDQILNDMADLIDQDFSKMKAVGATADINGDVRVEFERVEK